jgi:hypothetical protein
MGAKAMGGLISNLPSLNPDNTGEDGTALGKVLLGTWVINLSYRNIAKKRHLPKFCATISAKTTFVDNTV